MDEIYKINLTIETIENLIPGEMIIVPRKPMGAFGYFNGKSIFDKDADLNYPYKLIIDKVSYVKEGWCSPAGETWIAHTVLLCKNGYGWNVEDIAKIGGYLVNKECKSQNKFPFKIYKKNENWYIKN